MDKYECSVKTLKEGFSRYLIIIDSLASMNSRIVLPKQFVDSHFKLHEKYPVCEPIPVQRKKGDLDLMVYSFEPLKYDPENKAPVGRLKYKKKEDRLTIEIRKDFPSSETDTNPTSLAKKLAENYLDMFVAD